MLTTQEIYAVFVMFFPWIVLYAVLFGFTDAVMTQIKRSPYFAFLYFNFFFLLLHFLKDTTGMVYSKYSIRTFALILTAITMNVYYIGAYLVAAKVSKNKPEEE